MRFTISLGAVGLVGLTFACAPPPECTRDGECDLEEVCSREGRCVVLPELEEQQELCTVADPEDSLLIDPNRGFPRNDTQWRCDMPGAQGGDGPRIITVEPPAGVTAVTGSSINLRFDWGGTPAPTAGVLIYGIEGNGYFARNIDEDSLPSPINAEIALKAFAPGGQYTFFMGIDPEGTQDNPKPISIFRTTINVISVGSGDIQVNLQWDTDNDVDLHVVSPEGEHVFYANRTVPSGGQLDLDSNIGCEPEARNENVFWPTGSAIEGEYRIYVHNFSACAPVTRYTAVVSRDFEIVQVIEGTLEPADPNPNEFHTDGDTLGEYVTSVTWPP